MPTNRRPVKVVHVYVRQADRELWDKFAEAAEANGQTVSPWLAEAGRRRLQAEGLLREAGEGE